MISWLASVWSVGCWLVVGCVFGIAVGAFMQYYKSRRSKQAEQNGGNQSKK